MTLLHIIRYGTQCMIDVFVSLQAVSVVGRGEPVYSASPVPSTYDGRSAHNYPTHPANYPLHGGFSPQPNPSYSTHPVPLYSPRFGQEMPGGNVYHLVRPDHLQNIPTGAEFRRNSQNNLYNLSLQLPAWAGRTSQYPKSSSPDYCPQKERCKSLWTIFLEQF